MKLLATSLLTLLLMACGGEDNTLPQAPITPVTEEATWDDSDWDNANWQ